MLEWEMEFPADDFLLHIAHLYDIVYLPDTSQFLYIIQKPEEVVNRRAAQALTDRPK
jgi:hypothetical protein